MKKYKPHHRKNRSARSRKRESGFTLIRHPFSGVEPDIVKAALVRMAAKRAEEFPELLKTLLGLLHVKNPLHILAVLASYGLQAGVSKEGVADKGLIAKLEQHHVELLQALALTIPIEEWGTEPATPDDIQRVIDTVIDLGDAFHQRRFKAIEQERNLHARTVLVLQERLRMHTQVVRNWGYFSDVVQISMEHYAPLDKAFRKPFGYGASDVIAVARCLISTLERRAGGRFELLKRIFRERKINRMVRRYYKDYPGVEGDPEEFIKNIPSSATRQAVAARLLSHADLALPQLLALRPRDLVAQLDLSPQVVTKILNALSLQPGALQNEDTEHFFLSNPIWRSPVISLESAFFCAIPQGIFSHIHEVMRSLAESAGLKAALEARRAAYLAWKVERLLEAALPTAQLRHGVKWRTGDVEYETDHVAAIDKTVVIVEDKSATLTAPSLRGAPDRIKRHVRELVFDPSEQSTRLEAMIWRARAGEASAIASLSAFGMDFCDTERVVRISITLDDFSVLSSAKRELKEAEWIPADMALSATVNPSYSRRQGF